MNGRYAKQIRRGLNRNFKDAVEGIKDYVQDLPLKKRVKLAWNILFKKKFEF